MNLAKIFGATHREAKAQGVLFSASLTLATLGPKALSAWLSQADAAMLSVGLALVVAISSLTLGAMPKLMRALISMIWLGLLAARVGGHLHRPDLALMEAVVTLGALSWLWRWADQTWPDAQGSAKHHDPQQSALRGLNVGLAINVIALLWQPVALNPAQYAMSASVLAISLGIYLRALWPTRAQRPYLWWGAPLFVLGLIVLLIVGQSTQTGALLIGHALLLPAILSALPSQEIAERAQPGFIEEAILNHPARVMFTSFAGLGIIGGVLLSMPWAERGPKDISALDGIFTAFSAACVTGLAVLDTPQDFSFWGQLGILLLIQIGGLSIMAFSTMGIFLLGKRMSLKQEAVMSEVLGAQSQATLKQSLRTMMLFTLWSESLGAAMLTLGFWLKGDAPAMALWRGVFTSISAFCNAGFALQSDSVVSYQQSPYLLLTLCLIITLGGLGPAASLGLTQRMRQGPSTKLSLQVKLILWTSLALTASGFVLFLLMEWNNTLAPLSFIDKLTNALFQSVTLRTAGFNSLDLAALNPGTITLTLPYMFIGGSPGSTAGGAKTTTFALLLLLIYSAIRGHGNTQAFGFKIPNNTVYRAAAVGTLSALNVFICLLLLQVTQQIPLQSLLFETVSALGTVGLSIGATGQLDSVGKIIIIVAMFVGRLGPLTIFLVLTKRQNGTSPLVLPTQDVAVG